MVIEYFDSNKIQYLMKIKNFGKKSVEQVLEALEKQFSINLPKNKLYFH